MYETHFGLNNRVFHGTPTGSGIFVGPQTAKVMSGIKKALATADAAIAVTGQVGVGKTTAVSRALAAAGGKNVIISVGRVHLGQDEVLDQMLEELGANGLATGAIRKITVFRQALKQLQDKNARVVVIVEDAVRTGIETLAELEALTGGDSGVSDGANIVLMGDESLKTLLRAPELARLEQRTRMRQSIGPFSAGETRGYLAHRFREAGGEYDELFTEGCMELLHDLSGGVARVIDNLVESVLVSAAEQSLATVDPALVRGVADDEYGLTSNLVIDSSHDRSPGDTAAAEAADEAASTAPPEATEPASADVEQDDAEQDDEPSGDDEAVEVPELIQDTQSELTAVPESDLIADTRTDEQALPEPVQGTHSEPAAAPDSALIQDTQTELAVLPDAAAKTRDDEAEPAATPAVMQDTLPDLADLSPAIAAGHVAESAADIEDEPSTAEPDELEQTAAELKALQAAADQALAEIPDFETRDPEAETRVPELSVARLPDASQASNQASERETANREITDGNALEPASDAAEIPNLSPEPESGGISQLALETESETVSVPKLAPEPESETIGVPELALEPEGETASAPELALRPELEAADVPELALGPESETSPSLALELDASDIPELMPEAPFEAASETPATKGETERRDSDDTPDLPAWDRDPTLAELRPDIEALEQAMACAGDAEPPAQEPGSSDPAHAALLEPDEHAIDNIPEITLDASIRQTLDDTEESLPSQEEPADAAADTSSAPADGTAPTEAGSAAPNEELRRIASELAKARSIEDVDDKLAETLFGEDLSLIAAEVTANPPANDELELASPMPAAVPAEAEAENDDAATDMEREFEQVWGKPTEEVSIDSGDNPGGGGLDLSASQRLATVRALNSGGATPPAGTPKNNGGPGPSAPQPEPIEEQISTSMTQTLKALDVRKMQGGDESEGEEKKTGFFSRFRRS